jgi:two-component system, chemotaxis family, chemotaxis protein CheY
MNSGPKTMIIEDEEVAADLLEIMLNRQGIRKIVKATSGRQAIDIFKEGLKNGSPYSLVFLDIIMPEMDGQLTLKHLRAAEREWDISEADKAVIIMTTALTTADAMIEALFEGDCSDYLVKPIGPAYLREMLSHKGFISGHQ